MLGRPTACVAAALAPIDGQTEATKEHSDRARCGVIWYGCCSCLDVVRLAVVLAAPARGTKQLVHAFRLVASPTSLEPGCLGCRVWTEDHETCVRYEEVWATEEAMRLRVRSEGFTRLLELLEQAPEAPSLQFDFVTDTRGLDYVEEVRNMDAAPGPDLKSLSTWLLILGLLFTTLPA
jgi:quinol monooxygenase YgiN